MTYSTLYDQMDFVLGDAVQLYANVFRAKLSSDTW
jgi:hypothetical protein